MVNDMWNGLPLLVWGTGDTSREVIEIIETINDNHHQQVYDILGFVCENADDVGLEIDGYTAVACDANVNKYIENKAVVGAVIPFQDAHVKKKLHVILSQNKKFVFPNIIHPSVAMRTKSNELGVGNVIYSQVSITTNVILGDFNTINMSTTIGHDVVVGSYNSINPGCSISGYVTIGDETLIGTRSSITQGLKIGSKSFLAAGSIVIENVKAEQRVSGNFATNHMDRLQAYTKVKRNEKRKSKATTDKE